MKKILSGLVLSTFISTGAFAVTYQAPNTGYNSFYPMMQRQLENVAKPDFTNLQQRQFDKNETLDFANDPENYKARRDMKDAQITDNTGTAARNSNFNPSYQPFYGGTGVQQAHPVRMHFVKDADGNVKIQYL